MFSTGYVTLFQFQGVPVRIHWTFLLGALLFGGFRFAPGFWVGYFLLILMHEMGHVLLVFRCRLSALAIELHGFGGQCLYAGDPSPLQRSTVAWGGVLAQAVVLATTYLVLALVEPPTHAFGRDLIHAFTFTNMILIAINLLPFPPLDGAEAWKYFSRRRAEKRRREHRQKKKEKVQLLRKERARERELSVEIDEKEVKQSVKEALKAASDQAKKSRTR
ncbi:MAG: hypothetical protein AAGF12_40300 [Myxococcota bacterium]